MTQYHRHQLGTKAWTKLEEDISNILDTSLYGVVERKLTAMTSFIYTVSQERFGFEEKNWIETVNTTTKQTPTTDKRDSTTAESSPKVIQQDYIQHREDWSPTLKGHR